MGVIEDLTHMISVGPVPAETVLYCPYKGMPVYRKVQVSRVPLLTDDFVGGAESTIVEYQIALVNDVDRGVVTIQDGKDTIQMKVNTNDLLDKTFRVVTHQTTAGNHLLTVRL